MSNQLKKHKCRAKCGRLSARFDNRQINCFFCNESFYAQCFNINLDTVNHKSLFKVNSHVQFLCSTCYELLHQHIVQQRADNADNAMTNQTARTHTNLKSRSTDKASKASNANVITASTTNSIAPSKINDETLQLHASVKLLIDKLSTQPSCPPPSNCIVGPDLEAKLNNIYSLLIRANDKIDNVHTHADENESIKMVTSLIERLFKSNDGVNSTPSKLNNLMDVNKLSDWSMNYDTNNDSISASGRPSLVLHQSIDDDILNILRNSEARNWDALDHITKGLKDQSNKIDTILHQCSDQTVSTALDNLNVQMGSHNEKLNEILRAVEPHNAAPIASPLVDAIHSTNQLPIELDDCVLPTGNPPTVDKAEKEAMSQNIIKNIHNNDSNISNIMNQVPESSKIIRQKRHMPNLPGVGPGIGQITAATSTDAGNAISTTITEQTNDSRDTTTAGTGVTIADDAGKSSSQQLEEQVLHVMDTLDTSSSQQRTFEPSNINRARRELYVSKFKTHFTSDDIVNYMQHKGITDLSNTHVIRLTKKDQDISQLSFVSFKIETDDDTAISLLQPDFWPLPSSAIDFIPKSRKQQKTASICTSLNLNPTHTTTNNDGSDDVSGAQVHGNFLLQRVLHRQHK